MKGRKIYINFNDHEEVILSKKDARLIAKIMEISLEIVVDYQCSTKPPELLSFLASKHPSFLAFKPPRFLASKHPGFLAILVLFCLIKNGCMIFLVAKGFDSLAILIIRNQSEVN